MGKSSSSASSQTGKVLGLSSQSPPPARPKRRTPVMPSFSLRLRSVSAAPSASMSTMGTETKRSG